MAKNNRGSCQTFREECAAIIDKVFSEVEESTDEVVIYLNFYHFHFQRIEGEWDYLCVDPFYTAVDSGNLSTGNIPLQDVATKLLIDFCEEKKFDLSRLNCYLLDKAGIEVFNSACEEVRY